MLTTITPYWQRPEMLRVWLPAVKGASIPGVKHIIYFVGEHTPSWVKKEYQYEPAFSFVEFPDDAPGELSIGHYHNKGAKMACTKWIMKLDIDAIPNVRYFKELLPILESARPGEWFNGGMVMVDQTTTTRLLSEDKMPLQEEPYQEIMGNSVNGPVATNFICRTKDYLELGGCDERFRGYGWEDYQQIYMLEKRQRSGGDPLPGKLTIHDVTRRCCREISRPKARELWQRNHWLCLLHRFHQSSSDSRYKSHEGMLRNRQILFSYITGRLI